MKKWDDPRLKALGDRIRFLRKSKSISQEDLAYQCGIDRSYLGGIERGERNCSIITLYQISESLGYPVKTLFDELNE